MAILKDKSKKKKSENIIGKIIYGFLLFMPLIAVGVACLYAIFNKNAYQSYSARYDERITNVNDDTKLIENNDYQINLGTFKDNTTGYTKLASGRFKYSSISINWNDYRPTNAAEIPQGSLDTVNNFSVFFGNASNQQLIIKLYADDTQVGSNWYYYNNGAARYPSTINKTIYLTIESYPTFTEGSYTSNYNSNAMYLIQYQTAKLDNIFYYELERLEESNLFNWTKNTGSYTVMENVTTGIGITNTYTPMLMTYWLLISVIYFIFDIALILIWAVHDKIHELKDAI